MFPFIQTFACHEGLISWKIARRPGINNQNVFMQYVVGDYRTDTVVSLTPKPVLFLGVLKAAVPLGEHGSQNSVFVQ